jgi:hypothetical protein
MMMSSTYVALANEQTGTVCLGKNLAKPISEHTSRLFLKIDNSPKLYFKKPYIEPATVLRNLDLKKKHKVNVYFDNKVVESWTLNFSKLKTKSVLIWRAPGSWRMEPNEASSCK